MATIRSRIRVSLHNIKGWEIFQLTLNKAFLDGDLKEEVYMKVPEAESSQSSLSSKKVKSLYGLKQASRQCFAKVSL